MELKFGILDFENEKEISKRTFSLKRKKQFNQDDFILDNEDNLSQKLSSQENEIIPCSIPSQKHEIMIEKLFKNESSLSHTENLKDDQEEEEESKENAFIFKSHKKYNWINLYDKYCICGTSYPETKEDLNWKLSNLKIPFQCKKCNKHLQVIFQSNMKYLKVTTFD